MSACKDPGLALGLDCLCAYSPSHPLGVRRLLKCLGSLGTSGEERRGGELTVFAVGKTPEPSVTLNHL